MGIFAIYEFFCNSVAPSHIRTPLSGKLDEYSVSFTWAWQYWKRGFLLRLPMMRMCTKYESLNEKKCGKQTPLFWDAHRVSLVAKPRIWETFGRIIPSCRQWPWFQFLCQCILQRFKNNRTQQHLVIIWHHIRLTTKIRMVLVVAFSKYILWSILLQVISGKYTTS